MPLARNHVTLWLDGDPPANPTEANAILRHALQLASSHLRLVGEIKRPRNTLDNVRHQILRLLHPLGVHEWNRVLIYNPVMDRIIDPGSDRVVCRNCRPRG